jgi:hypothetical protein
VGPDHPWAGDGPLEPGRPAQEPLVAGPARRTDPRVGLAAPQLLGPGDRRLGGLGGEPDRVVVGGQVPGGGVGQDERAGPLRPGLGEEQRQRPGLGAGGQQRDPPRAGRVHDRDQFLGVHLRRRQRVGWQWIGGAGAAPVEAQQPGERGQPAQEQCHLGVFPDDVDMAEGTHGEHQVGRSLPEDLVGEPVRSHPRVLGLRLRGLSSHSRPLFGCSAALATCTATGTCLLWAGYPRPCAAGVSRARSGRGRGGGSSLRFSGRGFRRRRRCWCAPRRLNRAGLRDTRSNPSCSGDDVTCRRHALLVDVTQAASEVSRLIHEARDLDLPVEPVSARAATAWSAWPPGGAARSCLEAAGLRAVTPDRRSALVLTGATQWDADALGRLLRPGASACYRSHQRVRGRAPVGRWPQGGLTVQGHGRGHDPGGSRRPSPGRGPFDGSRPVLGRA